MVASSALSSASPRTLVLTLTLGAASAGLYLLLYLFSDALNELAAENRRERHLGKAIVPVIVALVFSFVHGAFTAYFWDLLGLRARSK
jgi:hypothetical protein